MSDRLTTHIIVSFWEVRIIDQSLHGLFPNHLYPFMQGEFTYNVWACDHMHSHRAKALRMPHIASHVICRAASRFRKPFSEQVWRSGKLSWQIGGWIFCLPALMEDILDFSLFETFFGFPFCYMFFFYRNKPFSFSGRWKKQCASDSIWLKIATLCPHHWSHRPDRPGWPAFVGGWWNFPPLFPAERPGCLCCITRKRWSTRLKRQEQMVVHHGEKNDRMIEWYIMIVLWYLMICIYTCYKHLYFKCYAMRTDMEHDAHLILEREMWGSDCCQL